MARNGTGGSDKAQGAGQARSGKTENRVRKGQPNKVDRQLLHEFLWKRAGNSGKVTIDQTKLAEQLGLSRTTVVRIIGEMGLEGRVKKISERQHRRCLYRVTDPETWKWSKT